MKTKLIISSISILLLIGIASAVLLLKSQYTPLRPIAATEQTVTTQATYVAIYQNDAEGIEFKYPNDVKVEREKNPRDPSLYIDALRYHAKNMDAEVFWLVIATTTLIDINKLEFDYQHGISKDNPEFNNYEKISPEADDSIIKSSDIITVDGKPALKRVVSDNNQSHPSTFTWIQLINNGKLYSLKTGILHGYDGTDYAATPVGEAKVQGYLNIFLSSVKFF